MTIKEYQKVKKALAKGYKVKAWFNHGQRLGRKWTCSAINIKAAEQRQGEKGLAFNFDGSSCFYDGSSCFYPLKDIEIREIIKK
jgi:hypothetical protein